MLKINVPRGHPQKMGIKKISITESDYRGFPALLVMNLFTDTESNI